MNFSSHTITQRWALMNVHWYGHSWCELIIVSFIVVIQYEFQFTHYYSEMSTDERALIWTQLMRADHCKFHRCLVTFIWCTPTRWDDMICYDDHVTDCFDYFIRVSDAWLAYLILLFTGWHWHTAPWRECMMIPNDIESFCTTFTPIYTSPAQLKHVSTSFVSLGVMHFSIIFSYLILLFTGWHWHTAPWRECMMIPNDIESFCTTFTPSYTSPTQLKHVSTSFVSLGVMHSSIIFSYPSWPNLTQNDLWSHYVTFVIKHVFTYFLCETPYQHVHERFKTIFTF
jgi:hypothetical protein